MENVMRVDFSMCKATSDGKPIKGTERPVTILYNKNIISYEQIKELIDSDMYEYCDKIIVTTPKRADALKGII